jgi:hypothetical protein
MSVEESAIELREGSAPIQEFIFARELAEVYLLLDHVSGRSDKSLAFAFDGEQGKGEEVIKKICNIAWPPAPAEPLLGEHAAALLMVKDRLNFAAKPASGASIAFSILVAGDDEITARRRVRRRARWSRRFGALFSFASKRLVEANAVPVTTRWEGDVPSRTSLAERAYPGLIATAGRFNRRIKWLIFLLFVWLIFTCLLSWNIAAGRATLVRLDAAKATLAATDKRLVEIGNSNATTGSLSQLATERRDGLVTIEIIRADLAGWLNVWSWTKRSSKLFCGSSCLPDDVKADTQGAPAPTARFDVWAGIVTEILATAVLPICYGFLGAGAAVVRSIYARMRDSLLSPRDLILCYGQLALGAVIGACIGLFVSPTSADAQAVTLMSGASTLSLAALSFIAGFGVESVFVALESLIRRIFNVSPPTSQSEARQN